MVISHANNHLFHLAIVSDWLLSIPLHLGQTTRLQLMYFTHHRLCGHRLQWVWFAIIYLAPGDADVPQHRLKFSDMSRNC